MAAGYLQAAFRLLPRGSQHTGAQGATRSRAWAITCVGLWAAIATLQANAAVILPDLPAGSQYQIVFTSLGGRDASSGNISAYDNFVRQQAALSSSLPSTTWWAVASAGQNAQTTAKVYDGIPVYNTAGQLVASSGSAFYSAVHQAGMNYDQNGDVALYAQVWTGMWYDGTPANYLDTALPTTTYGFSGAIDGTWARGGSSSNRLEKRALYGLSEPIAAVPEPSAWGMAAAVPVIACWLQRRYPRVSRTNLGLGGTNGLPAA